MAKRTGLGKGLGQLIPSDNVNEEKEKIVEKVVERVVEKKVETIVKLSEVEPNKSQPRKNFNEDALMELADSIKQFGVIQPLIVQKRDDYYEIIAGERRWRAAKLAGLKEIPVIIKDYTDEEIMEIALIENIQREDLNPIEEAMAYKKLLKEYNLKQDEIAERVSKSRVAITNSMRLLKLSDEVQNMIVDEMITSGHGRALLAVEDKKLQTTLANKIFDEKLSVRETEKLVKDLNNPKEKKEKEEYTDTFVYENIEKEFKEIIGSNVTIKRKSKDKGKIEIDYYSNEDLERIMELIKSISKE
jgi:ParB family chromosome partitioning protein